MLAKSPAKRLLSRIVVMLSLAICAMNVFRTPKEYHVFFLFGWLHRHVDAPFGESVRPVITAWFALL